MAEILKYRKETHDNRVKMGSFNYVVTGEHKKILEKCTIADDETIIKVQIIESKSAIYFGEIKRASSSVPTKQINYNQMADKNLTKDNFLIESRKYQMHGRGMYFDK